jgi:hypothetical protein
VNRRGRHPNGRLGHVDRDTHTVAAESAHTERAPLMDTLADPFLRMAADALDDLERVRIANENRLRQLTRSEADTDGEERGFGLTADHPSVKAARALVDGALALEHQAELNLGRLLRAHPLGPWMKAQPGVGPKQGARLLAALGDPYMRPDMQRADGTVEPARPRRVSELWAYAGLHVVTLELPADPGGDDAHILIVGGDLDGGNPDQALRDTQGTAVGVAASRRRGQRSNWSDEARKRAYLVAAKCVMQADGTVWRDTYTAARAKYADAIHKLPCPRCGPSGKPAPIGSPLSDGHKHARALRIVSKSILRELWREAGRLHGADTSPPTAAIAETTPKDDPPPSGPNPTDPPAAIVEPTPTGVAPSEAALSTRRVANAAPTPKDGAPLSGVVPQ